MSNEEGLKQQLIPYLDPYFDIQLEVWSKDHKRRIDMIITDKSDKDIVFGIECKKGRDGESDKRRGNVIGKHLHQCLIYSFTDFPVGDEWKRIPIIMYPPLSVKTFVFNSESNIVDGVTWYKDRHKPNFEHHSCNGMLGHFGIGEIRSFTNDFGLFFCILFNNKIVWSSRKKRDYLTKTNYVVTTCGVHLVNYYKTTTAISKFNFWEDYK